MHCYAAGETTYMCIQVSLPGVTLLVPRRTMQTKAENVQFTICKKSVPPF